MGNANLFREGSSELQTHRTNMSEPAAADRGVRPGERADLRPRPPRAGRRRGQQRAQKGGAADGVSPKGFALPMV